jgi:hypothetical protein
MFRFSFVTFRCILRPHGTSPSTRYSSRRLYHSRFNSLTSASFPSFSNSSFSCFDSFHSYFVNNQSARRADGLSISLPRTPVPPSINVPVFRPMLPPFVTYRMLSLFPLMPSSPFESLIGLCTYSVPMSPSTPPCTHDPCACLYHPPEHLCSSNVVSTSSNTNVSYHDRIAKRTEPSNELLKCNWLRIRPALSNSPSTSQAPEEEIVNNLPPRRWLQERAPRSFEDLWSDGYVLDDEAITFEIDWRDEYDERYQDVKVYKYKTVDKKVKPVPGTVPDSARVVRRIPEDPLLTLPLLSTDPPEFEPTTKITVERMAMLGIDANTELWPKEKRLFKHVMAVNEHVLAWTDEEKGMFRDDYFSPYVFPVEPHVPWMKNQMPIPPGLFDKYIAILKEKLKAGVYERSQASYRSTYFCVLKKNGSLRMVHDLQPLNAVSIRDTGTPPVLDEFVESFAGRQIFTVLDMFSGYDSRSIALESRDMTSFMTPLGLMRLTSLPMGYTNAVAEYQNCMTFILQDEIPNIAGVFIDDVCIKGDRTSDGEPGWEIKTIPENEGIREFVWKHAQDVHRIMHRVGCAGGTFSGKKGQIGLPEVLIIGQLCTREGRIPDTSKIDKILKWPLPRAVKEVRGFLGLCGTMRIWIENYSQRARPLVKLTRKDAPLEWLDEQQESFDDLKACITQAPILVPIDYRSGRMIILSVDTSYIAVGFILSQVGADGKVHPARYGSIPMNEREARYSQPKLELYGLFRALRATRYWIVGVPNLTVELDAKYVQGMIKAPDMQPSASENRWIQGILRFDFKIVHVPATRHKGPDALSRREPTDSDLEAQEGAESDQDFVGLIEYKTRAIQSARASQERALKEFREYYITGKIPVRFSGKNAKRFLNQARPYQVEKGVLFKRSAKGAPKKVIFDQETRKLLMKEAHDDFGHRGVHAVFETLRSRFQWPYLYQDVVSYVQTCHECQIRSVKRLTTPLNVSEPGTLFSKIYVDVMDMPLGVNKYKYIVAARDDLTQAAEGRALKKNNSKNVAAFLWEEIICRYGSIGEIVTDNGPEFGKACETLIKKYGIPQIRITPYNSRANGVVERGHFIIRESIIKACGSKIGDWPNKVHHAFFADKIMPRRTSGFTPFYLLHGVDAVMPFDLTEATFLVKGFTQGMSTVDLLARRIRQLEKRPEDLARVASAVKKMRYKSKEAFEAKYAARMRRTDYNPGDLVLLRNSAILLSHNRKSKPRYFGPFEVVRKTRGGSYVLCEMNGAGHRRSVNATRLLPYYAREEALITDLRNEGSDQDSQNNPTSNEELEEDREDEESEDEEE